MVETRGRDIGRLGHDLGERVGERIWRILQRRTVVFSRNGQGVDRRQGAGQGFDVAGQRQRRAVDFVHDQCPHRQIVRSRQHGMQARGVTARRRAGETCRLVGQVRFRTECQLALLGHSRQQIAAAQTNMVMGEAGCRHRLQHLCRYIAEVAQRRQPAGEPGY